MGCEFSNIARLMANLTDSQQIRPIMDNATHIRNVSIVAHFGHGKSTILYDLLLAAAGVDEQKINECRQDEIGRGYSTRATSYSLCFEQINDKGEKNEYLINLIDTPGHADFSSEVTTALRVSDGALVVVDCIEGVCLQTETVLLQALAKRVKSVLMINKLDRVILELQLTPEDVYQTLSIVIETTNLIISTFHVKALGDMRFYPEKGTVCFGSGLHGWGFTLDRFAKMYAKKFGVSEERLIDRLWGDNFFDPKSKKWTKRSISSTGKQLKRAFCRFILDPIYQVLNACMNDQRDKLDKMLSSLGIKLSDEELKLQQKRLLKVVMYKFLPASEGLLDMMVLHLPSPVKAQGYRYPVLYDGPLDDRYAQAIASCDSKGPLIMYVSKMVPSNDRGRFYAFGRVFSGTIRTGQSVRIMGPKYIPGKKEDLFVSNIQRMVIMVGCTIDAVEDVPCGNIVGLVGVDQYLVKTGTIVGEDEVECCPLKNLKFSVSPKIQVVVEPMDPRDLPKLIEGLKRLAKVDPLVQCFVSESHEYIVAGAGELHLEVCIGVLQDDLSGIPIKISDPIVPFCETVTAESSIVAMTKSPNKHSRIYMKAEPIEEELANRIEQGEISFRDDVRAGATILTDEYGWDQGTVSKIWCFGPDTQGPNLVVDQSKSVQFLNEIKDSVVVAFQWASKEGVLANENMRGIRFNLLEAVLQVDSMHRSSGQIIPATRRCLFAAQLSAQPRFLEPVFLAEIQASEALLGSIYGVLSKKRGQIISKEQRVGTSLYNIKAHLPVVESFSFTTDLRNATTGQVFPQMVFDHWALISSDPLVDGRGKDILLDIRRRKGLREAVPHINDYQDRL